MQTGATVHIVVEGGVGCGERGIGEAQDVSVKFGIALAFVAVDRFGKLDNMLLVVAQIENAQLLKAMSSMFVDDPMIAKWFDIIDQYSRAMGDYLLPVSVRESPRGSP